ncbi:hypothetical protein M8C21_004808 [Ambrosia artemisiifolia]|uniref:Uncharacterized protein n=1 Tax=Ambrosia artemisiifolia TaxID=4212 RepID=A0AAD5CZF6_AMBAR|nr:hypothetical protein M8C21_004808 [Ambrosia artemisiifolia]
MFSKRLLLVFAVLLITSEIATASELASHHESKVELAEHDHDVRRHLKGSSNSDGYETRHPAGPISGYNLPHGVPCCKT